MNAPKTCPKCGAELIPPHKGAIRAEYQCGSEYHKGVTYNGRTCTESQLASAQVRVKELEAKLAEVTADRDSWIEQADQRATDAVEAMKREEAWKKYAGRLEHVGDVIDQIGELRDIRKWTEAKETKPCRAADGSWVVFECHSNHQSGSDPRKPQSRQCEQTERDRLAARVKELEPFKLVCENPAALWTNWLRGTIALPAGIGDVRERDARIKELEAERDTWRAYAGRLEEAGNKMHWAFMHPFDVSHDACPAGWTKAKETKP